MNENKMIFNTRDGHNHDGVNSARVVLPPESIELSHLSADLLEYLQQFSGGGQDSVPDVVAIEELAYTTQEIDPGQSEFGEVDWVSAALVSQTRVIHSVPSKCDIVFFHTPEFRNEDREFKAVDCTDKFMWEGVWAHTDETGGGKIYYKVTNTSSVSSTFTIQLKSATMVVNGEASGSFPPGPGPTEAQKLFNIINNVFSHAGMGDEDDLLALYGRYGLPSELAGYVGFVWTDENYLKLAQVATYIFGKILLKQTVGSITATEESSVALDSSGEASVELAYDAGLSTSRLPLILTCVVAETGPDADAVFLSVGAPGGILRPAAPLLNGIGSVQLMFFATEPGDLSVDIKCPGATSGNVDVVLQYASDAFFEGIGGI